MNHRYLLFAGYNYYPSGGWDDLKSFSDDIGVLKGYFKKLKKERYMNWGRIVDLETRDAV